MDLIGQDDTGGPHPGVPAFAVDPHLSIPSIFTIHWKTNV
jgi:hypothetical protein